MASLKYQENGEIKELAVKIGDTLPIGTEVDYNGSAAPSGWVEIEDLDDKYVSVGNTAPTTGERVWFKKSKNLIQPLNSKSIAGLTISTNENGETTITGKSTYAFDYNNNIYIKLKAGIYTFSVNITGNVPANSSQIILRNSSTNTNIATINLWSTTTKQLTLAEDTIIDTLRFFSNSNYTYNISMKLQLEEGSTATTYEPYVEYKSIQVDNKTFTETVSVGEDKNNSKVWFKKGKNLVDKNTVLKMTTINATTGLPESTSNFSFATQLIKVKPNTDYYVKAGPVVIYAYDTNKTFMSIIKNNAQAGTFNTGTAEYIRGRNWWANNINELNTQINNAFIYEGTTDTTYEEYITPSINVDGEEIYQKQEMTTSTATVDTNYISNTEQNLITRVGQLVEFDFIFTTTGTWTSTTKMFTGLPKPNTTTKIRFIALKTNPEVPLRFQLNADGSIQNGYSNTTISSGQIIEGHITYITIE